MPEPHARVSDAPPVRAPGGITPPEGINPPEGISPPAESCRPDETSAAPSPDALVRGSMALVGHEVRDAMSRVPAHVSRDDLVSAGMFALAQAARAWDVARGVPFAGFARHRVRGAILDELRQMDWASRSVRRRARELDDVRARLTTATGRVPGAAEVAAAAGLTATELSRHGEDVARASISSLHDVADDSFGGGTGSRPVQPEAVLVHREQMAYLHDAITTLPDRLRCVVEGYFFHDRPMAELAAELSVTESRISQMRAEAIVLMRHALDAVLDPSVPAVLAAVTGPATPTRRSVPDGRPGTGASTGSVTGVVDVVAAALVAAAALAVPAAVLSTRAGVVARRRAEYVDRVASRSTCAQRLAYVADTELSQSA